MNRTGEQIIVSFLQSGHCHWLHTLGSVLHFMHFSVKQEHALLTKTAEDSGEWQNIFLHAPIVSNHPFHLPFAHINVSMTSHTQHCQVTQIGWQNHFAMSLTIVFCHHHKNHRGRCACFHNINAGLCILLPGHWWDHPYTPPENLLYWSILLQKVPFLKDNKRTMRTGWCHGCTVAKVVDMEDT